MAPCQTTVPGVAWGEVKILFHCRFVNKFEIQGAGGGGGACMNIYLHMYGFLSSNISLYGGLDTKDEGVFSYRQIFCIRGCKQLFLSHNAAVSP
jgi:hypothetical protein